jgi:hypothetical protein
MFPDGLYPKFVIRHREIVFPVSSTYRNNLEALEQWRIIPRILRDAPDRDLEVSSVICSQLLRPDPAMSPQTTLFGVKLSSPVLLAPVGVQGILHEDGEQLLELQQGRGSTDHVFCEHAFDRSCGQGQRRRSPVVPAILVHAHPLLHDRRLTVSVGHAAPT